MNTIRQVPTLFGAGLRFLDVLKTTIVHAVRLDTGRTSLGFISALFKPLSTLALFYIIIEYSGVRGLAIRGNTITFLLTGIFCFLLHTATIAAVSNAVRKSRGMLYHAPATIFLYVMSQALSTLYLSLFAALTIWAVADMSGYGLEVMNPRGLVLPYFLSWASGLGLGMIMMAIGHVAPTASDVISSVYTRAQFFTSGKFWAANTLSATWADYFGWNPLLHIIDQMRGAAFLNYYPKYTNLAYPVRFALAVLVLGWMAEFWVRRSYNMSRGKR